MFNPLYKVTPTQGAVLGVLVGVADYLLCIALGIDLRAGSETVTHYVALYCGLCFGALGWMIGRLNSERQVVVAQQEALSEQLVELNAAQKQLIDNDRLVVIGRAAAGVAHEVRNPLAVIRSSASLVMEGDLDADDRRMCAFIIDETDRLNSFVTRLLDFSRPLQVEVKPLVLRDVAERGAVVAADVVAEYGCLVSVDIEPEVVVMGDADVLPHLFSALIDNACRMHPGGVIHIAVAESPESPDPAADSIRVDIDDGGPGLAPEVRETLFEPFVTTRADGTGLGLAMVARIVRSHGGTVSAMPRESGGLRISATLPMAAVSPAAVVAQ